MLHYCLEYVLNHGMKHINIITINTDINEGYKINEVQYLTHELCNLISMMADAILDNII